MLLFLIKCSIAIFTIIIFLIPVARAASSVKGVSVEDLTAGFSPGNGLELTYRGVPIIRESSVWVVAPGWTSVYYGFGRSGPRVAHLEAVVQESQTGGKILMVEETKPDQMDLRYEVRLLPEGRVEIELSYRWLQDKEADMEYAIGLLSAVPLVGATYEGESTAGETFSGKIPFEAVSAEPFQATLARSLKRLVFHSRLGDITLEAGGEDGGPILFDGRKNVMGWARPHPVFWCGYLGFRIPQREWKTIRLDLKIAGRKALVKPPLSPAVEGSGAVQVREDVRIPATGPVRIIPRPHSMEILPGQFKVDARTKIVVGDKAAGADLRAGEVIQRELRERFGRYVPVVRAKAIRSARHIIVVGERSVNAFAEPLCEKARVSPPEKEEGYCLVATPHWVVVSGHDRAGTFWGAQSLIQMLSLDGQGKVYLPAARILDYPSLRFRGIHLIPDDYSIVFHKRMIERVLSRYKINRLVIECEYARWDSHPEIHQPWAISKSDLRKLIEVARAHFMEVYPLVQSLGHCEWIFKDGQNLDIAEDKKNPYAYCPSNPRSYEFIFSVIDEAIDLFDHPKYLHIGHDEVSMIGEFPSPSCERCRDKTEGELFLQDTLKLYEHLKGKGVQTMMWGDMLLTPGEAPDAANAKTLEEAQRRRDALPEDIVIADWHYAAALEYPNVALLQKLGFEVVGSTWYSHENIRWFARALEQRKALGLLQTTWAGYHGTRDEIQNALNQIAAYIVAADCAWNPVSPALEATPYNADHLFLAQWDSKPLDRRPKPGFTVDLTPFGTRSLYDDAQGTGWLGYGPEQDLRNLPTGDARLGQMAFQIAPQTIMLSSPLLPDLPDRVMGIPIGQEAASLLFLVTSGWPVAKGTEVGYILVHYEDGTQERVPLIYGENIAAWTDFENAPRAPLCWEGKTPRGTPIGVRLYTWQNPYRQKRIAHLDFIGTSTAAAPVLLGVTGLTRP